MVLLCGEGSVREGIGMQRGISGLSKVLKAVSLSDVV
jgi:hypothetical protein